MRDLPIACTLSPGERRGRASELLPELLTRAESYERLDEGLRLRFTASSETLLAITRVLDTERQCCQFFRFRLTIEPGLGPILLDVQGPAGTAGFLTDLIATTSLATSLPRSSSK
jgi:hypothetical protein